METADKPREVQCIYDHQTRLYRAFYKGHEIGYVKVVSVDPLITESFGMDGTPAADGWGELINRIEAISN